MQKVEHLWQRRDRRAPAEGTCLERGAGGGEAESARQLPASQQSVDVAAVKDVAAAGGIDGGDSKDRLVKGAPVGGLGPAPPLSQGHRHGLGAEREQPRKNLLRPYAAGQLAGKLLAHDQMIHQRQERFGPFAQGAAVEDRGHTGGAGDAGGRERRRKVEAVKMEDAGVTNDLLVDLFGCKRAGAAAIPKDGPFPLAGDGDEGKLTAPPRVGQQATAVNTFRHQTGTDAEAEVVVADATEKGRRTTQARDSDQGGRNRPPSLQQGLRQFDLAVEIGPVRQPSEQVESALA